MFSINSADGRLELVETGCVLGIVQVDNLFGMLGLELERLFLDRDSAEFHVPVASACLCWVCVAVASFETVAVRHCEFEPESFSLLLEFDQGG